MQSLRRHDDAGCSCRCGCCSGCCVGVGAAQAMLLQLRRRGVQLIRGVIRGVIYAVTGDVTGAVTAASLALCVSGCSCCVAAAIVVLVIIVVVVVVLAELLALRCCCCCCCCRYCLLLLLQYHYGPLCGNLLRPSSVTHAHAHAHCGKHAASAHAHTHVSFTVSIYSLTCIEKKKCLQSLLCRRPARHAKCPEWEKCKNKTHTHARTHTHGWLAEHTLRCCCCTRFDWKHTERGSRYSVSAVVRKHAHTHRQTHTHALKERVWERRSLVRSVGQWVRRRGSRRRRKRSQWKFNLNWAPLTTRQARKPKSPDAHTHTRAHSCASSKCQPWHRRERERAHTICSRVVRSRSRSRSHSSRLSEWVSETGRHGKQPPHQHQPKRREAAAATTTRPSSRDCCHVVLRSRACVCVCVYGQLAYVRASWKFIKKQQPLNFYMRSVACFNFDQLAAAACAAAAVASVAACCCRCQCCSRSPRVIHLKEMLRLRRARVCVCACFDCVAIFNMESLLGRACERDKRLFCGHFHWLSKALWILGISAAEAEAPLPATTWRVFNFLGLCVCVCLCACATFPRAELCSIFQFAPHQIIILLLALLASTQRVQRCSSIA